MDTKSLLNLNSVEPFNAKQLYKKVIAEFDNYKTKLFVIDSLAESSLSRNMESREEQKNGNSDKTFSLVLKREKLLEQVKKFEGKITFLFFSSIVSVLYCKTFFLLSFIPFRAVHIMASRC